MGMYDIIWVPCPKCGNEIELQSKSGRRCLDEYTLETVPNDVLTGINSLSPYMCESCNTKFSIDTENIAPMITN